MGFLFKVLSSIKNKEKSFIFTFLKMAFVGNFIFIFLSGYLMYAFSSRILTSSALNYTQSIMKQAITNVDSYIVDYIKNLKSLAKNNYIIYCLDSYPSMDIQTILNTEYKFSGFINSILEIKPDVYDILIVGNNGYIYDSETRWDINPSYDFRNSAWYKNALEYDNSDIIDISVVTLDFYVVNSHKYMKKSVAISCPIRNYKQEKTGVIFFFLGLDEMVRNVLTGKYKEFGEIFLIGKDSSVIAHADESFIGSQFSSAQSFTTIDDIIKNYKQMPNDEYLWVSLDSKFTDCRAVCRISLGYIRRQTLVLQVVIVLCLAASIVLNIILSYIIYRNLHKSIDNFIADMDSIKSLSSVLKGKDYKYSEFNNIASRFSDLIERLKNLSRENYEIQISLKNAKLATMTSQLNPHFLFNTLQLLQTEIIYGNTEVSNSIILSLGNLFRYSTSKVDAMVQIRDEINFTRDYLAICQKSYDTNLAVNFSIDEKIMYYMMPKFVIQPIVENSIKHGFAGTPLKNSITVTGYESGHDILFTIEDDGIGMSAAQLARVRESLNSDNRLTEGSGIGLKNIHQRIKILFGEQYGLRIESEENSFTKVCMLLPRINDTSAYNLGG